VDPEAVFEAVARFDEFRRAQRSESPEKLAVAERLFLLIDGRQPVRRVVDLSRLGSFEGARWLTRFRRAGLIERVAPAEVAKKQRRRALEALAPARSLLGAVLALLPWLLLGAVVLRLAQLPDAPPSGVSTLAQRALLQEAETSFETLRLRNLADAYRYARGGWPAGPTDLRRFFHEARRRQPLAALDPREYYFAQRGDSFLVLAPEE
jgi:hypothetical protein